MSDNKYKLRGVSATKEDVHKAIGKIDKGLFPKAFCKIVPDFLGNDDEYCVVMHADGAGTKSSLAYMYWKETGDLSVWKNIAQDAIVMNTDDLLCVGATDNILLSSTIGRNKNLIPAEVISEIINGTESILEKLRSYGIGDEEFMQVAARRADDHAATRLRGSDGSRTWHPSPVACLSRTALAVEHYGATSGGCVRQIKVAAWR